MILVELLRLFFTWKLYTFFWNKLRSSTADSVRTELEDFSTLHNRLCDAVEKLEADVDLLHHKVMYLTQESFAKLEQQSDTVFEK